MLTAAILSWQTYKAIRASIIFLRSVHVAVTVEQVNIVWRAATGKGMRRSDICRYVAAEAREDRHRIANRIPTPFNEQEWIAFELGLPTDDRQNREPIGNRPEPQIKHEFPESGTLYASNVKPNVLSASKKQMASPPPRAGAQRVAQFACLPQQESEPTKARSFAPRDTRQRTLPIDPRLQHDLRELGMGTHGLRALAELPDADKRIRDTLRLGIHLEPGTVNAAGKIIAACRENWAAERPVPGSEHDDALRRDVAHYRHATPTPRPISAKPQPVIPQPSPRPITPEELMRAEATRQALKRRLCGGL